MRQTAAARTANRRLGPTAAGLLVVVAAIIATLGHQPASSPGSANSFRAARAPGDLRAVPRAPSSRAAPSGEVPRGSRGAAIPRDGAVSREDGALPDGVTVADGDFPGITRLDPDLLQALHEATTAAAHDGVVIHVNSGWRSPEYQDRLFREAVSRYGSEKEAARWVATADRSAHVAGDAVDVGPFDATAWLSDHGAEYGLCQVYRNEAWHYELRPDATERGCPRMYADSAHDPRARP